MRFSNSASAARSGYCCPYGLNCMSFGTFVVEVTNVRSVISTESDPCVVASVSPPLSDSVVSVPSPSTASSFRTRTTSEASSAYRPDGL
ncbi:hypothetical protein [Halorussus caseinilyticus]|uniref:Uncharacterized protein n=1 Tax=Halorussus caseinilyticus TaxID=3034025 RepID=A0ABD5WNA6_9EURY